MNPYERAARLLDDNKHLVDSLPLEKYGELAGVIGDAIVAAINDCPYRKCWHRYNTTAEGP
jgi:hypothetical protein